MKPKNRVISFETISTDKLKVHPKNFRQHDEEQKGVLRELSETIGIAGAGLAYKSEKYGGLTLIDGHLRKQTWDEMPVLILDLNDEEAEFLLATYDRVGAMADENEDLLKEIIDDFDDMPEFVERMFDDLLDERAEIETITEPQYPIQPNVDEGYDYVVIFCRQATHFTNLVAQLDIGKREDRKGRVGQGRVITYEDFTNKIEEWKNSET